MRLFNELVLTFWAPIKYTKAQFNPIILSRVFENTTNRHTFVKTVSKRNDLMKILKVIFHICVIYDENVPGLEV